MNIISFFLFKKLELSSFTFSISFEVNELIKSLNPNIKKANEAMILIRTSGSKLEIEPPANAPSKLAKQEQMKNLKKQLKVY